MARLLINLDLIGQAHAACLNKTQDHNTTQHNTTQHKHGVNQMQIIITKYLGPTNRLGSRYKATHTGNYTSVTLSADYSMNAEANHVEAALALAEKLGWEGDYTGGHTKDGMVFVNSDDGYCFRSFGKKGEI